MISFKVTRKKAVINNNQIQKAIVINYYIENDFYKVENIDYNFNCFIE